ncbi:YtxH domain-containing protein [Robertkochia solimangrovi]|uniref:YtxH domain-containing protein n=1 Tax=Robertkochia solimangrovi TaxID=2213046 RepID=UPI00117FD450|nr:YtxH domain-containing protein [Robertkochia solimangrovi]TRZ46053.1 YtxH domain-containing protein [Robertkochia solimangrovi]
MSNNTGNTLLALLTGAAIGAGIGILYAPESGSATRKRIKKNAKKAQKEFEKQYARTKSDFNEKVFHAKTQFDTKLNDTLNTMSYKADDIIDALENKLDELKNKNAKLKKDTTIEKIENEIAKATK